MPRLFVFLLVALLASSASAGDVEATLKFWVQPEVEQDPRVVRVSEHHACSGYVAEARVRRIPQSQDGGPLESETVEELDDQGNSIHRWSIPVDSWVAAVRGSALIVRTVHATDSLTLSIEPDGKFRILEVNQANERQAFTCPDSVQTEESAFRQCSTYIDQDSGRARVFTYEGLCT